MTNTTLLDGGPATGAELATLAFAGFGHFTAMQVRNGRMRGLDLHLQRLRLASHQLFGRTVADEHALSLISKAIVQAPDASLVVTMFLRSGEFVPADDRPPSILTRTSAHNDGPDGPLRLDLVHHERWWPAIKHVGEGAKTYLLHAATARGFDDAAFTDRQGRISEGSIWNLAFWDGRSVIWPEAAMLNGVTMGILRRQLAKAGVSQRNASLRPETLDGVTGAVVMNSWTPAVPVSVIGNHRFDASDTLATILRSAYDLEPWQSPFDVGL